MSFITVWALSLVTKASINNNYHFTLAEYRAQELMKYFNDNKTYMYSYLLDNLLPFLCNS